jgi:putative membrane protein
MSRRVRAAASLCLAGAAALRCAHGASESLKAGIAKDETVYAILESSGAARTVVVSDRLENRAKAAVIQDSCALSEIENVSGDEGFAASGRSLTWAAAGKDIYYQGKSAQPLPLKVRITYYLDGKEARAESLAGASGLVRVSMKLESEEARDRIVDGKRVRLALPFVAAAVFVLPASAVEGLDLSPNARSISDGKNVIVMGLLFPGLGADLRALGINGVELPDELAFSGRAARFSLGSVLVTAAPGLSALGNLDPRKGLEGLDPYALTGGLKVLAEKGDLIQDAVRQLHDGSVRLRDGMDGAIDRLAPELDSYRPVIDGALAFLTSENKITSARRLLAAAEAISEFDQANPGDAEALVALLGDKGRAEITKTLADARDLDLSSLASMPFAGLLLNDANIKGLRQTLSDSESFYRSVDEKRLKAARDFCDGAPDYSRLASDLASACQAYDSSKAEGLRGLSSSRPPDEAAGLLSSVGGRAALAEKVAALPGLSEAERSAISYMLRAEPAVEAARASSDYVLSQLAPALAKAAAESRASQGAIASAAAFASSSPEKWMDSFVAGLLAQRDEQAKNRGALEVALTSLSLVSKNGGVKKTVAKVEAVQADLAALEPALSNLEGLVGKGEIQGLLSSPALGPELGTLVADLRNCRELLALADYVVREDNLEAARELAASAPDLAKGLMDLRDGSDRLAEGLGALDEGFTKYNLEGIQPLASKLGGYADTLAGLRGAAETLLDLSASYDNFSGLGPGMEGRVRFVMRTDGIAAR